MMLFIRSRQPKEREQKLPKTMYGGRLKKSLFLLRKKMEEESILSGAICRSGIVLEDSCLLRKVSHLTQSSTNSQSLQKKAKRKSMTVTAEFLLVKRK